MPTKCGALLAAGLLALGTVSAARADWVQLDGGINYSQTSALGAPRLAVAAQSPADDMPYAVITEDHPVFPRVYRLYVYRWNNTDWQGVTITGSFLNNAMDQDATEPAIAAFNDSGTHHVAVAWSEMVGGYSRVFVKRWSGGDPAWQLLSQVSPVMQAWINVNNQHANNPSVALPQANPLNPIVAWQEVSLSTGTNIYVKAYNGTDWVFLPNMAHPSEALNRTVTSFASLPQVAMDTSNRPVVAWQEEMISPANSDIYVSRWDGMDWDPLGGSGLRDNPSIPARSASLAIDALNRFWVAFLEGDPGTTTVKVKRYNGSSWEMVGNPVLTNASVKAPRLALVPGQQVFLSLLDTSGPQNQVRVFVFENPNWVPLGGSLNVDPGHSADVPHLSIRDGQPIVIWPESTPNTITPQVFVKQWIPATPTPTVTLTPTTGPTLTPTPPPAVSNLAQNAVLAYPNPASRQVAFAFRADSGSGTAVARLYNTHYRLVAQASADAPGGQGSVAMDVSGIAQGVYFYQVTVNGKKLPMGKVVVAR